MPWFLTVTLLIAIILIISGKYLGIKHDKYIKENKIAFCCLCKYKVPTEYKEITSTIMITFSVIFLSIFVLMNIGGYLSYHNKFILIVNIIGAKNEEIKVLKRQEISVLNEIENVVKFYLKHEGKTLKDLKIDKENIMFVLTQYPSLRSSETVKQYMIDIKDLRIQITKAQTEKYQLVSKYNSISLSAFSKHFRPKELPQLLKFNVE